MPDTIICVGMKGCLTNKDDEKVLMHAAINKLITPERGKVVGIVQCVFFFFFEQRLAIQCQMLICGTCTKHFRTSKE